MTGVVAFSLFGHDHDDIYRRGALVNAQMYGDLYPDVICRFYVSPLMAEWASKSLAPLRNTQVFYIEGHENQLACFWRYWALEDKGFDFYLFRDVDSRPIRRERAAVREWLDSDRTFHVMRDHPYHNVPMLAGLWGVKNRPQISNIHKIFRIKSLRPYYQVDQQYLRLTLWRMARKDCLSHVHCDHVFGDTDVRPFPEEGDPAEGFVGEGFYGDGRPRFPHHARELVG